MHHFAATLHTLGVRLRDATERKSTKPADRGSITVEQVFWAVAALTLGGIVLVAITAYVRSKAGEIR